MRRLVAVVAAAGLFAVALLGFGHLVGAWESPADADAAESEDGATHMDATETNAGERRDRDATKQRRTSRDRASAHVGRRLDGLCRSAREDALALLNHTPPTEPEQLEEFFDRLRQLNRHYNTAMLQVLDESSAKARVQTLRRLFHRDEKLFDQLVSAIDEIDSPVGRAFFESRLETLRGIAARQTRLLEELGAQACDTAVAPTA